MQWLVIYCMNISTVPEKNTLYEVRISSSNKNILNRRYLRARSELKLRVFYKYFFSVSCVHIRGDDFACQVRCLLFRGFQHAFAFFRSSSLSTILPMSWNLALLRVVIISLKSMCPDLAELW